jgi:hypothetical protein
MGTVEPPPSPDQPQPYRDLKPNVHLRATVHVEPGAEIAVNPPRFYDSEITGGPNRVPWIIDLQTSYGHGGASIVIETRELLEEIRDAITAALDAHPGES